MSSSPIALAALVGANLLPLVGVLLFDWSLFAVMLLYWAENGVIGVFNVVKMLAASRGGWFGSLGERLFLVPFFTVHYGGFWLVHGVFVFSLFGSGTQLTGSGPFGVDLGAARQALGGDLWIALLSLVASHGVSFVLNFVGDGEFRQVTPSEMMFKPYGRVVILHVTIILGGFVVMALGEPIAALLLMVALKIGVDVAAHLREHRVLRASSVQTANPAEAA
ncbi:MAG: DUF6498-containing protein [Trueperaceae bacterium]|nr:DUF6498-containing protein [Trueperaceae bacterium]